MLVVNFAQQLFFKEMYLNDFLRFVFALLSFSLYSLFFQQIMIIDTHSHLYMNDYDEDLAAVIDRAKASGVGHIVLAGVDSESLDRMLALEATDPKLFCSSVGLHPTSVKEDYRNELALVKKHLDSRSFCAIGEAGLDLYHDKTFFKEQIVAFEQQIEWALEYDLPLILHVRNAFDETYEILQKYSCDKLRGIFHCFGGSIEEAQKIMALENFKVGINGIVTFKKSILNETLRHLPLDFVVLETDAPWLAPTPYRGKRNEPAYLQLVVEKLAEIYAVNAQTIENRTTENALKILSLPG